MWPRLWGSGVPPSRTPRRPDPAASSASLVDYPRAGASAGLRTARAHGDSLVHLGDYADFALLCGRARDPRPALKSFRVAGCRECLVAARDAGHCYVSESAQTWINLVPMQRSINE